MLVVAGGGGGGDSSPVRPVFVFFLFVYVDGFSFAPPVARATHRLPPGVEHPERQLSAVGGSG